MDSPMVRVTVLTSLCLCFLSLWWRRQDGQGLSLLLVCVFDLELVPDQYRCSKQLQRPLAILLCQPMPVSAHYNLHI